MDRAKGNGLRFLQGRFFLNNNNNKKTQTKQLFTIRTVGHWNKLPREGMKETARQGHKQPSIRLCFQQKIGPDGLQRSFPT